MSETKFTPNEIESKVFSLVAEQVGFGVDEIARVTLLEPIGFDSRDCVELVMAIEDEFDLSIPDETFDAFLEKPDVTAGDVVDCVAALAKARGEA